VIRKLASAISAFSLAIIAVSTAFGGTVTTFSYTQSDISTGSGTIAAPENSMFGGVTITWTDTAMPAAFVRDPAGVGTAGGAVGGFNAKAGDTGENGEDVALYWNATADVAGAKSPISAMVMGSGSDGNAYQMPISLVFFGDNVLPDEHVAGWGVNDYQWSLDYGGNGVTGSPRTGIYLSPSWANVDVADGGGGRQQRYTQNDNALGGNVLTNTDTTSGAEKDAFDQNGNTDAFAAIGQPLEISFGWRDRDDISGPVLVDNFNFKGLLGYDERASPLFPNQPHSCWPQWDCLALQ